MFFQKRIDRSFDTMNERNKRYIEKRREKGEIVDPETGRTLEEEREWELEQAEAKAKAFHEENDEPGLEKGDLPALLLSAFLVFGPILLVLAGILSLGWWLLR